MAKIFINPGHAPQGQPDPGAVNASTGLRECDVALIIGNKVSGYLQNAGCTTRVQQDDSLENVVGVANWWGADAFVSIHCNSAANESASGAETWYCHNSEQGEKLAYYIQSRMTTLIPIIDRGLKEATPGQNGLYVLTNTDMTAVLVETAFISNDGDEKLLADEHWQDEFARAIARGVTDFFSQG